MPFLLTDIFCQSANSILEIDISHLSHILNGPENSDAGCVYARPPACKMCYFMLLTCMALQFERNVVF